MADFNLVQDPGTFDTPDYSGSGSGGSWWNDNGGGVINAVSNTVGDLLQFGLGYAALNNGQPVPNANGGGVVYVPTPQQQSQSNTALYIGIAVLVLLLVLGGIFLATRKK